MRLNDSTTFIGINPPYQLSVIHSSKLIYPREIYQRGVERPILCKVYTGLTMEQEALLFAEQNGHAAPLTAGIKQHT